ncbi:MAG: aldo/keto reductase [Phycisphaeraceae bacterium]|nr:MAG: aldo/keto reductase [Phycisphaeraceae bacterium]
MSLDRYITLGRSGLRVSPLCLGAMTFGEDWGFGADVDTSKRMMDIYMDRGGNFIDGANIYTKGHSEQIIGEHIGRHGARRDRVVIATKFFGNMHPGDPNAGGGHRKSMMTALDESLDRLQTDYIDLYWLHAMDPHTPIEETMRALDEAVRAGKIRYIGFSDVPAWICSQAQTMADFRGWSPVIAIQIEYSLLERTVEGDLTPMAMEMGMGVMPWSPLKGGALSGKYTRQNPGGAGDGRSSWISKKLDDKAFNVIDVLIDTAKQIGATPAQVALAWVQAQPGVASSVIGARKIDQLEDNLGALDVRLSAEQLAKLNEASKPTLPFPHDFLKASAANMQGGTTINGVETERWHLSPDG